MITHLEGYVNKLAFGDARHIVPDVAPDKEMSNDKCDQSTTKHEKRTSVQSKISTHRDLGCIDSSAIELPGKGLRHVSRMPLSICYYAMPGEIRNLIDEYIFRTKFTEDYSLPVPTTLDSGFVADLDNPQGLALRDRILAPWLETFCERNTLSIIMDRSSRHQIPGFLTKPNIAQYIKHLAVPQLENRDANKQYTFPLAVLRSLTGLKTISFTSLDLLKDEKLPYGRYVEEYSPIMNRLPLSFWNEVLVKRPEVEVIVIAYYYHMLEGQEMTVHGVPYSRKSVREHHTAIHYRLKASGRRSIREWKGEAKEGDAIWQRGMLKDLMEKTSRTWPPDAPSFDTRHVR